MINLIKYESKKYFNEFKWYVIASFLLGLVFVLINAFTKTDGNDLIGSMSLAFCIGTIINLLLAPIFQAIFIYARDLNKNYSVLESSLPYTGLEKYGAKLIVGVVYVIFTGLLAFLLGNLLLNFSSLKSYASNISIVIDSKPSLIRDFVLNSPKVILSYIANVIYITVSTLISTGFLITLHSVLRYKVKGSTPIVIFVGLSGLVLGSFIRDYLGKIAFSIPMMNLSLTVPEIIDFILIVVAFFAVTYMLDKKTELA